MPSPDRCNSPSRLFLIGLTFLLLLVWILPRLSAIVNNPLLLDDFYIGQSSEDLWIQEGPKIFLHSYRPLIYAIYQTVELAVPDHLMTVLPKILAGLFLSVSCSILYRYLCSLGLDHRASLVAPVFIIVHPIVNEITLWNSMYPLALAISLVAFGYTVVAFARSTSKKVAGTMLMFAGTLGYQAYLSISLVMLTMDIGVSRLRGRRDSLRHYLHIFLLICAVAGMYIAYMLLADLSMSSTDPRGITTIQDLGTYSEEKLHGIFNLIVNVWMPLLSYYFNLETAWRHWELVPLSLCVSTFILAFLSTRSLRIAISAAVLVLILPFVGALFILATSQSPESWRTSVPSLYGTALSIPIPLHYALKLGKSLSNEAAWISVLVVSTVIVAVLAPIARYESVLRVKSYHEDLHVLAQLSQYWEDAGVQKHDVRVAVFPSPNDHLYSSSRSAKGVTKAYQLIQGYSPLGWHFSWRGFVVHAGFRAFPQREPRLALPSAIAARACNGLPDATIGHKRIYHSVAHRVTVICF